MNLHELDGCAVTQTLLKQTDAEHPDYYLLLVCIQQFRTFTAQYAHLLQHDEELLLHNRKELKRWDKDTIYEALLVWRENSVPFKIRFSLTPKLSTNPVCPHTHSHTWREDTLVRDILGLFMAVSSVINEMILTDTVCVQSRPGVV